MLFRSAIDPGPAAGVADEVPGDIGGLEAVVAAPAHQHLLGDAGAGVLDMQTGITGGVHILDLEVVAGIGREAQTAADGGAGGPGL